MRNRWAQRNAWIVWFLVSSIGWAAIFSLSSMISNHGDKVFANTEYLERDSSLAPASGPSR